jgi:hypothetical protein
MELLLNKNWTERCGNAYIAYAIACSGHGNDATIYTVGMTAGEANTKLIAALRELQLIPEPSMKMEQPLKRKYRTSMATEEIQENGKVAVLLPRGSGGL